MEYQWQLLDQPEPEQLEKFANELNVSTSIASILIQRGVDTFEKARSFFRAGREDLHDPFLMRDMDKAVERIQSALETGEKIMIYGDYDVDGTTAVALVYSFFREIYDDDLIEFYIPDRYKEGYGISKDGIDHAHQEEISMIIALDCGIQAHDKVDYAAKKGIDFIICDHHLPGDKLPKAIAVLDQKRSDCEYPYKELTGCGIGFKLIQALAKTFNISDDVVFELLDLVGISTCCDIVPITGENRILVREGLKKLNTDPRVGLRSFVEASGKLGSFNVTDLVFTIGPRINAAGRIEHGKKAVELLLAQTELESRGWTHFLETSNEERKELDKKTTAKALEMISREKEDKTTTVLFSKNWHKGVIGIVASRVMESYYRPTIMLTLSNGKVVGSARSVKGFDIHEAIGACAEHLEQFGGHQYAAGLTMLEENVDAFKNSFEAFVSQHIDPDLLIPKIKINATMDFAEIDQKLWSVLKQFAPFGPSNMKPVFVTENVVDAGYSKKVGDGTHLKLNLKQKDHASKPMNAIAFGMGQHTDRVKSGEAFDVVYTIEENHWNGQVSLQLMVKDLRFSPS